MLKAVSRTRKYSGKIESRLCPIITEQTRSRIAIYMYD